MVILPSPAALKITTLDSNDEAVKLCQLLLSNDPRSYYQIRKAMMEENGGYAPGVSTLKKLGDGDGPRLQFETMRRIANFYGLTIVLNRGAKKARSS